tara:strand:- start:13189 stop:13554 length:366 start_codon:yes stop_codon:yes gene_type:complete
MSFIAGQSVMYNSKCCTVFRTPGKSVFRDATGYLIKENKTQVVHDNVQEGELSSCSTIDICNECWGDFTYTGDNQEASKWIINYLLKHLGNGNQIEWGSNSDNTQYFFKVNDTTLTKDRTS